MFFLRRVGIYTALVAVIAAAVLPVAASAQATTPAVRPPLSLTTSPLPLNVTTKPGQTVTADIRVKNNGTQQEFLKVELLKFGAAGDTGRPQLLERDPKDQYFNWVSFSESTFTSEPNVWKTIHMKISPPKEAAFGYYYAVLFSRANPDKPTAGNSALEGGVASLVLLTVDAPGARREAQITQISAQHKVYEFLPASFTVRMKNGGNVHVAPTGTLFIKRGSAQVATIDFNAERGNILPGTDRVFGLNWSDGFPSFTETEKDGKTVRKLNWDFSKLQKLRFGRYTANLVAVYDDGQRDVPVEGVVTFWVIPWRILGVIFLILLIIFIGIWGIGRVVWRGIRRQVIVVPPSGPAAAAVTIPDEEVDPSSLAAAPTRSERRKQKAEKKARQKAEQKAQQLEQKTLKDRAKAENKVAGSTMAEELLLDTSEPARPTSKKTATAKKTTATMKAPKAPVGRPKSTTSTTSKPKLAVKKPLATKPRPTLATKGRPAGKAIPKKKGSEQ